MSPRPYSLWGRTINEYFLKDPANAFFPEGSEKPSSSHIKAVVIPQLNRMCEPAQDTCSLFISVLSLLRDPKELRSLDNTMLLNRCMFALQNYADDSDPRGNKLFTYEYGFLCFRVIVLLVQVGILTHTKTFNAFAKQTGNIPNPHDVSVALSKFVMKLMMDSTKRESNPRDWFLGLTSSRSGDHISLKSMGGLTDVDVCFLLKILWQDRKRFSEMCTHTSTPGWALLFVLVGEHLQCASDAGWYEREEWCRFWELTLRYSLFASSADLGLIEMVCTRFDRSQPNSTQDQDNVFYEGSLVDAQDARTLLEAFISRMKPSNNEPFLPRLSALLLGFIRQDMVLGVDDLVPSFARSLCLSAWAQLEAAIRPSTTQNDMTHLVVYMTRLFGIISRLYDKYDGASATIIRLTTAMVKVDFLNLSARILLLPLSIQNKDSCRENGILERFRNFNKMKSNSTPKILSEWTQFLRQAEVLAGSYSKSSGKFSNKIVDPDSLNADWMKIWRCFDLGFPHCCGPCWGACCHPFGTYIHDCQLALLKLVSTFKPPEHRPKVQCAYPRCSAALFHTCTQFSCGLCSVALYCSRICQAKHWIAPIGSHRELCTREKICTYRSIAIEG